MFNFWLKSTFLWSWAHANIKLISFVETGLFGLLDISSYVHHWQNGLIFTSLDDMLAWQDSDDEN